MERKKDALKISIFSKIDIYLEDIKELQKYFTSISPKTKIETDENVFEAWDDFYLHVKKTGNLTIASYNPRAYLHISKNLCYIDFAWEDREQMAYYFYEIKNIIEKCERKRTWFLNKTSAIIMSVLVGTMVGIKADDLFPSNVSKANNMIIPFIFIGLIYMIIYIILEKTPNKIYLKNKIEVHGFWDRKKEDIFASLLSNAIIAILSFALGLAAQYYLKIFNENSSAKINTIPTSKAGQSLTKKK
jgi:hypothetical protein